MHDGEPDTFEQLTLPEEFSRMLAGIGVDSEPNAVASGDVERGDYYSRAFASSPRMVTNRGSVEVSGSSIDAVHLVQKG